MQSNTDGARLIELKGIGKRFPGVVALDSVDLAIQKGETHVLLGQNGAGKSTLVNILSGIYSPDSGTMRFDGKVYSPASPRAAMLAGIQMIHQELNLLNYLSVAENIFFQDLPNRYGLIDYSKLNSQSQAILDEVGLSVSPKTLVGQLSVAQMQMVEIAKALSGDRKLLIMDEPTAALTNKEISRLFEIIGQLKERGVTIIYISHRLQEIYEIGDRFTVLRNGTKVATEPLADFQIDEIVKLMVGHDVDRTYPFPDAVALGSEVLRVDKLMPAEARHDVSFAVRSGEILGIAGLVGSGRSEVLRAIFGADPKKQGTVYLDGNEVSIRSPREAVELGISLLTENRKEEGLVLDMECGVNITLANLNAVSRHGLMQQAVERKVAQELVADLDIKTPSTKQLVRNLSGGNQQKIVLAKWLFRDARVIMVDEPTRGIDVGARFEIYQLLCDLAMANKATLVVSSDLPELMGICHRILVFSNGRITGELPRDEFDQERILALAYQGYIQDRTETA